MNISLYSKTCLKRPLKKKTKNWFSRPIIAKCRSKVLQNAPREHSAILLIFIKLPFVLKIFVLSIFEWRLKTGFNVYQFKPLINAHADISRDAWSKLGSEDLSTSILPICKQQRLCFVCLF